VIGARASGPRGTAGRAGAGRAVSRARRGRRWSRGPIVCAVVGIVGVGCKGDRPESGSMLPPPRDGGSGGGGGRPGVSGTRTLSSLSDTEIQRLCQWGVDVGGGDGRVIMCSETESVEVGTVEECRSEFPSCDATVREAEDCILALWTDPCNLESIPPECGSFFEECESSL